VSQHVIRGLGTLATVKHQGWADNRFRCGLLEENVNSLSLKSPLKTMACGQISKLKLRLGGGFGRFARRSEKLHFLGKIRAVALAVTWEAEDTSRSTLALSLAFNSRRRGLDLAASIFEVR